MEKAASVAEATGDVVTAANAWVDVAFIAVVEGFDGKRRESVANARSLAEADGVSDSDRDAILVRIEGAPITSAAARVAMIDRLASPSTLLLSD
jgi:hypothetical protein